MRDALLVRHVERIANPGGLSQSLIDGQRALKRRAVDVLQDEIIRTDIMQRADIRPVQGGNGPRFALEALGKLLVGNFDLNNTVQTVSRALYTSPIPPAPICERTSLRTEAETPSTETSRAQIRANRRPAATPLASGFPKRPQGR